MLLLFLMQTGVAQQPLNLTCFGSGTANKFSSTTVNSYGSFSGSVGTTPVYGSGNSYGTITSKRQQQFGDQVTSASLAVTTVSVCLGRCFRPSMAATMDGSS
jgi:hypothetical protein